MSESSVALSTEVNDVLLQHLVRHDGQEDLTFALWTPSQGARRRSALIHTVLLPETGDRTVHGNVSFNAQYLDRACRAAMEQGCGVALLHSHPGPGWQGMSKDDIVAEHRIAPAVAGLSGLPLVGLTTGSDGTWSARFWEHAGGKEYKGHWCHSVRVVGSRFQVSFTDALLPKPAFREALRRTISVWGDTHQAQLARLRIGIVGLGSVGSMVAESLARMGMTRFVLIDFDRVEEVNLDRLVIATPDDIGRLKVSVAAERMRRVATAEQVEIAEVPYSVVEEPGYRAALDCDVIFSCVDRPRPRSILDHLAYAHLVPVIDGGIQVRFKRERFSGVDWQLQTVGPGRPCLECLEAYDPADVSTEAAGMLDDPSYLAGLPPEHRFRRNENVFPFAANLASLEVLQLVALATGIGGMESFGVQRYRYVPGVLDADLPGACRADCDRGSLIGRGDHFFQLYGRDLGAERARTRWQDVIAASQLP